MSVEARELVLISTLTPFLTRELKSSRAPSGITRYGDWIRILFVAPEITSTRAPVVCPPPFRPLVLFFSGISDRKTIFSQTRSCRIT